MIIYDKSIFSANGSCQKVWTLDGNRLDGNCIYGVKEKKRHYGIRFSFTIVTTQFFYFYSINNKNSYLILRCYLKLESILSMGRWREIIRPGSICWIRLSKKVYLLRNFYTLVISCYLYLAK